MVSRKSKWFPCPGGKFQKENLSANPLVLPAMKEISEFSFNATQKCTLLHKTGFMEGVRKVVIYFSVSNPIEVFEQVPNIWPSKMHIPKGASMHLHFPFNIRCQWSHSIGDQLGYEYQRMFSVIPHSRSPRSWTGCWILVALIILIGLKHIKMSECMLSDILCT